MPDVFLIRQAGDRESEHLVALGIRDPVALIAPRAERIDLGRALPGGERESNTLEGDIRMGAVDRLAPGLLVERSIRRIPNVLADELGAGQPVIVAIGDVLLDVVWEGPERLICHRSDEAAVHRLEC